MDTVIEQCYVLSYDEIKVLLFGVGVNSFEGIYMPNHRLETEDIIEILQHLFSRGLLIARGSHFSVRSDLMELLETIRDAGRTFILRFDREGQEYFCYEGEKGIVVSESCRQKEEAIRVRLYTKEAFIQWKEMMEDDYCGSGSTGTWETI